MQGFQSSENLFVNTDQVKNAVDAMLTNGVRVQRLKRPLSRLSKVLFETHQDIAISNEFEPLPQGKAASHLQTHTCSDRLKVR